MATYLYSPVILTQSSCCQGNLVPDIRRPLQETKQLLTNNSCILYRIPAGNGKDVCSSNSETEQVNYKQHYNLYHTHSPASHFSTKVTVMAESNSCVGLRVCA